MAMQGIDIASYQSGIDLSVVPADFVIVKATQGTDYVNPDCVRAFEQARSAGRCVGVYHYVGGQGAVAEADFFVDSIQGWLGTAVLVIDWESIQNAAWDDEGYLETLTRRVIERTGIAPIIYASASVFPWGVCERCNCGTWVAQYASMDATGYQDSPWNEGAYSCAIRQYSSCGYLPGWDAGLDLNKAYMGPEEWMAYATGGGAVTGGGSGSGSGGGCDGDVLDLVAGVFAGRFGNGDDRRAALGDRYDEVQGVVNHVMDSSAETLAGEVMAGTYGNGDVRRGALGPRYDEVQAVVNAGCVDVDDLARRCIAGEFGNGDARREALGGLYDEVQARVNEML